MSALARQSARRKSSQIPGSSSTAWHREHRVATTSMVRQHVTTHLRTLGYALWIGTDEQPGGVRVSYQAAHSRPCIMRNFVLAKKTFCCAKASSCDRWPPYLSSRPH